MNTFANELPIELPVPSTAPCLSLYQPTHRHFPDNQQDPIRFRNLVKTLESSLRQKYSARDVSPVLEPFHTLAQEPDFWNHTLDGLAVLAAPGLIRIYKLQTPVAELAIAADSFHTKPLLRIIQSADRYQVLALTRGTVNLFEGNRYVLDEIELAEPVPRSIHDAIAARGRGSAAPTLSMPRRRGYGEMDAEGELDANVEHFFRAVDRAVLEQHSRVSGLPLILAALPEYHNAFRRISQNPFLIEDGIKINPGSLTADELRQRSWSIMRPRYAARINQAIEDFQQAKSRGMADDELAQVAAAVASGRVELLLIEAEREIPGHLDPATGTITSSELSDPQIDDVLDDIGELALQKGGQVVVIPAESMPTQTGLAAIYRY